MRSFVLSFAATLVFAGAAFGQTSHTGANIPEVLRGTGAESTTKKTTPAKPAVHKAAAAQSTQQAAPQRATPSQAAPQRVTPQSLRASRYGGFPLDHLQCLAGQRQPRRRLGQPAHERQRHGYPLPGRAGVQAPPGRALAQHGRRRLLPALGLRPSRHRTGSLLVAHLERIVARIDVVEGDITHLDVDAIVNPPNESLLGGGAVDGAIQLAAAPGLLAESPTVSGLPPREA